jgi:hypothetical protein
MTLGASIGCDPALPPGWTNFERIYRPLAAAWAVYDNSGREAQLLETSE